jgi:hypothetical protein
LHLPKQKKLAPEQRKTLQDGAFGWSSSPSEKQEQGSNRQNPSLPVNMQQRPKTAAMEMIFVSKNLHPRF